MFAIPPGSGRQWAVPRQVFFVRNAPEAAIGGKLQLTFVAAILAKAKGNVTVSGASIDHLCRYFELLLRAANTEGKETP